MPRGVEPTSRRVDVAERLASNRVAVVEHAEVEVAMGRHAGAWAAAARGAGAPSNAIEPRTVLVSSSGAEVDRKRDPHVRTRARPEAFHPAFDVIERGAGGMTPPAPADSVTLAASRSSRPRAGPHAHR